MTCSIWNAANANWRMKYFFWYCLNTTVRRLHNSNISAVNAIPKWGEQIKISLLIKTLFALNLFLLRFSFAYYPAFYFNMRKSYKDISHSPLHDSVITENILITIVRFARYHLLLASNNTFMTDSLYLGTIQICRNLNEHYYYYLISTASVIWQIDANGSTNILGWISNFSKWYFKTCSISLLLLSLHVSTDLEFDSNYFSTLFWKIVTWP